MNGWEPTGIRLLCAGRGESIPEMLRRDYALRIMYEMEISNALRRGGGTVCQRREAQAVLCGSKAVRMREAQVLRGMMDGILGGRA